ncbi:hypothetical protein NP493_266g02009 [Ridgeia piscesae]|uniref:EF-hand domain-containing protein n=1 Tax=Ridgeia piscesae TaxID=27915 RepID=A0AAD9UCN8_RIDPI|nr:hypothetical protein NP493_266g02009 [Ridgeia piscesae]
MATASVLRLEDEIRTTSLTKRIRPEQFFLDFDPLRSGYVTESQFFRILWENLGVKLNEDQEKMVAAKYMFKGDGNVNYRTFCKVISQPFKADDLTRPPDVQKVDAKEFLGTSRSLQPLNEDQERRVEALLQRLNEFYTYHGINLRTSCEDFDWHHRGVIQESQFYRSFPKPPGVTDEDVFLLVLKYRDPDKPGLVNYLNIHHDLLAVSQRDSDIAKSAFPHYKNVTDYLPTQPDVDLTLQQIFDKIRVAIYKNRVRSIEYFKDYDRLRSGIITEHQFNSAIVLAIGKEAQLSPPEVQKIIEYYRTPDGRVQYKEFCDMLEHAFNVPELEKKPTIDVVRPPAGALGRNLPIMTDEDERRVVEVVNRLAEEVRKRRILVYPYFKDFDRANSYSRVITPMQFRRILHFLTLNVNEEDFKLLCRKFADQTSGDINYPAFVQTIDQDFVNYTQGLIQGIEYKSFPKFEDKIVDIRDVNMDDLMARIRHHALTKRLRVSEFFQDFDQLRSGSITKTQFRRCLSDFGLSTLGEHDLTDVQFEALAQFYKDPKLPDKIMWHKFMWDIESVFTQPGLEKDPTHQVPPSEMYLVPKPGTMQWEFASDEHHKLYNDTMTKWSERVKQRRVLVKPVFQDFDKHNNGHITRQHFRQCLRILEMSATETEMQAVEARFCDDVGFHYSRFLEELDPNPKTEMMYVKRIQNLRVVNDDKKAKEDHPVGDLESVLKKVKTMVVRERVRILEWMKDYDKLRSGRMPKSNFRRALDLCRLGLYESELALLEDHYKVPGYEDKVDYMSFTTDVESVFTVKEMEKAPLLEPERFKPPDDWSENQLSKDYEGYARNALNKMAERVRETRMQLFPLFEDFDEVHNGTVTQSQFRRVLCELELARMVPGEHEWVALQQMFGVRIGGKVMTNYNAFCDAIYGMAGFEWRRP